MDLHLNALYECDAAGYITASRDPEVTPPPFHLVRSFSGNRWLLRASLPSAQRDHLASILQIQPRISDCDEAQMHPPQLEAIRALLEELAAPVREYRGPAFVFPNKLTTSDGAELLSDLREAPSSGPLAWLRGAPEASRPIAVVRAGDGEVVSACYAARSTSAAAEAGVETTEGYRGRGYGSKAVIAWAAAVRESGRVPLYSTEWENSASRRLASRIGLICYAEDLHIG